MGSISGLTAQSQRCNAKWVPNATALPRNGPQKAFPTNGIYQTHGWCLVAPREDPLAPPRIFFPLSSLTTVPPPRPSWGPSLPAVLDPSSQEALWACCHQCTASKGFAENALMVPSRENLVRSNHDREGLTRRLGASAMPSSGRMSLAPLRKPTGTRQTSVVCPECK